MSAKVPQAHLDNVRELYEAGKSYADIAKQFGAAIATVQRWIAMAGVKPRPISDAVRLALCDNNVDIADDVIRSYIAGASEKRVAEDFSVSRSVIRRLLLKAGIRPRDRSRSMFLRMKQTSPEHRSILTCAAHDAVRGKPKSEDLLGRLAVARQRTLSKVGNGEDIFCDWLRDLGLQPIQQFAAGRYNIDIAIPPVAVEIHVAAGNPTTTPKTIERIKYLIDLGWNPLYVWVTKGHFLSKQAARDTVTFHKTAKRNPTACSKYRVIRGSGKLVAEGSFDLD